MSLLTRSLALPLSLFLIAAACTTPGAGLPTDDTGSPPPAGAPGTGAGLASDLCEEGDETMDGLQDQLLAATTGEGGLDDGIRQRLGELRGQLEAMDVEGDLGTTRDELVDDLRTLEESESGTLDEGVVASTFTSLESFVQMACEAA